MNGRVGVLPASKERTSAVSMAGKIVQSVGGRNPRRMRVPRRMVVSEVEIKAGSVKGKAGKAFYQGGENVFGRRVRNSLQKGSQNREFQSGAIVIRNVLPNIESMEFVLHVSGSHGELGGAPGFGKVKKALGRRVPRFGGHQRNKVEAIARAGARACHGC